MTEIANGILAIGVMLGSILAAIFLITDKHEHMRSALLWAILFLAALSLN
jgi:hypothetical protein